MYFNALSIVSFFAIVASLPLKRDINKVLSDLSTISASVTTLDNFVNAYTGSTNQSLVLVSGFTSLDSSFKLATRHTDRSYPFNEADSESLANAVTAVTPNIITLLEDLDAKASVVAAANYTSTVEKVLTTLSGDVDDLLTALTDKVTEEQTDPLGTSADELNYAFNVALLVY